MTDEQKEVLRKVDEMLNDVCMPTYSKISNLLMSHPVANRNAIQEFRTAVQEGRYTTAPKQS